LILFRPGSQVKLIKLKIKIIAGQIPAKHQTFCGELHIFSKWSFLIGLSSFYPFLAIVKLKLLHAVPLIPFCTMMFLVFVTVNKKPAKPGDEIVKTVA
jgi:hypothetical protein